VCPTKAHIFRQY